MEKYSLETKLFLREREYHLRTSNNVFEHKVISSLFLSGEVISSREILYEHTTEEDEVFNLVKGTHDTERLELESLVRISDRLSEGDHAEAHNKLGLAFLKRRMYREAVDEFLEAVKRDAEFPEAHSNLGKACVRLGMHNEAIEVMSRAIELAPGYADFHNNLGRILLQQRKCRDAIKEFEAAIEINPYYGEAHYNLALAYIVNAIEKEVFEYATDLDERTTKELETAIRINPSYDNPQFQRGERKLREGQLEAALQELQQALDTVPVQQESDLPLNFYLRFLYDEENLDESSVHKYVETLEDMLQKNPDYADLRNYLGVAYTILCRYVNRKSVDQFKLALGANPAFKAASRNLKLAENDSRGFHLLLNTVLRGRDA
jgi:Tfp pilus assembly protein PilF